MPRPTAQADLRSRRVDSRDRRVQRTRASLVEAYRGLLDEEPPVTVSAVVERAGVTRSSFYAHFAGLDELAVAALTDRIGGLVASARAAVLAGGSTRTVNERVFLELARFLDAHRDTYGALLVGGGAFADSLVRTFADLNLETLHTRARLHADPEVTAHFFAGGIITVLSWWLQSDGEDDSRTPEDLARALIDVAPRDFAD